MILIKAKPIKYILAVIFMFFSFCPAMAIDETADTEQSVNEGSAIYLDAPPKDLKDTIKGSVSENSKNDKESIKKTKRQNPLNLFREQGYQFEKGPIKSQRITFFTHSAVAMDAQRDKDFGSHIENVANELIFTTLFADEKTRLDISYNFTRSREHNKTIWGKITQFEVTHTFNEHQTLKIGDTRLPNGYEGGSPSSKLNFVTRSQIARNFGNSIAVGVRNQGNYKYLNYDIAFSDGSRFLQGMLGGAEATALVSLKPLADFGDKYGNLKIGGSIDHGRSHSMDFTVVGGHLMYNYKNFYWETEYQFANNYAGSWYNRGKAHGLYSAVRYFVTPKIEVLARYDFFQKLADHHITTEYTVGANYHINPVTKLMLNYVIATNSKNSAPSHRVYMGIDIKYFSLVDKLFELL